MTTASVGFHCPECARSGKQQVYTRANIAALNRPLVTQGLIAVNVAVFVVGLVTTVADFRDGGLAGPLVAAGDWWRIISSGFLHGGGLHLFMNMYLLFVLGGLLEPALGRARFAAIYGTSLLTGSLGVLLLEPNAITVGASGAVFGLMGALYVIYQDRGINPWSTGIGPTIAINLVFTFLIPNISIGGHIGGLVGGALCGLLVTQGARSMGNQQALGAVIAFGAAAFAGGLLVA